MLHAASPPRSWPGDRHIDMKGVLLLPTGAGCPAADG